MPLTTADWADFRAAMREAHDSFNQAIIVWQRVVTSLDAFGEDSDPVISTVNLRAQISDNYLRSWPVARGTITGAVDDQSIILILNKDYLEENGWLNSDGYFAMNFIEDRFIYQGITYEPAGDTSSAQAYDDPIFAWVILKRHQRKTGDRVYA